MAVYVWADVRLHIRPPMREGSRCAAPLCFAPSCSYGNLWVVHENLSWDALLGRSVQSLHRPDHEEAHSTPSVFLSARSAVGLALALVVGKARQGHVCLVCLGYMYKGSTCHQSNCSYPCLLRNPHLPGTPSARANINMTNPVWQGAV